MWQIPGKYEPNSRCSASEKENSRKNKTIRNAHFKQSKSTKNRAIKVNIFTRNSANGRSCCREWTEKRARARARAHAHTSRNNCVNINNKWFFWIFDGLCCMLTFAHMANGVWCMFDFSNEYNHFSVCILQRSLFVLFCVIASMFVLSAWHSGDPFCWAVFVFCRHLFGEIKTLSLHYVNECVLKHGKIVLSLFHMTGGMAEQRHYTIFVS